MRALQQKLVGCKNKIRFYRQVVCDTSKVTEGIDWFVLEGNLAEFEDISWKHFSLPQAGEILDDLNLQLY